MEWKYVKGTNKRYSVSNTGLVMSNNYKRLIGTYNRDGYLGVSIDGKYKNIHRIVAEHFVNGDISLTVNHIDGDKSNNNFENLEFITMTANNQHRSMIIGKLSTKHKLNPIQVKIVKRLFSTLNNQQIGNMFNVSRYVIRDIRTGRTYKHISE